MFLMCDETRSRFARRVASALRAVEPLAADCIGTRVVVTHQSLVEILCSSSSEVLTD